MSIQSYRSLLEAGNWSGSAPWQVFKAEAYVDIAPLWTDWSRSRSITAFAINAEGGIQTPAREGVMGTENREATEA